MKRTATRRKPRTISEWHRIYGSAERVQWITMRPCDICGKQPTVLAPSHNAHVTNGGTGRKADADKIISACDDCHHELDHGKGKKALEREHGVNLLELAAKVDGEWNVDF